MKGHQSDVTYVCLAGGLGNQLFQLAAGLYVSGENPLVLLTDLSPTRQNVPGIPDLAGYNLPNNVTFETVKRPRVSQALGTRTTNLVLRASSSQTGILAKPSFVSIAKKAATPVLRATLAAPVSIFGAKGISYDPKLNSKIANQLLIGYFQTWRYLSEPSVSAVMQNLSPRNTSPWLEDLKVVAQQERPLVVHVRLGDFRNNPEIGTITPSYVEKALHHHRSNGNTGRVWLFSDEPNAAIEFLPDSERKMNPRVVAPPSMNEHPTQVLEAMRLGQAFVISNSTFGWWAAWLSLCAPKNIVFPSPWFSQKHDAQVIQPQGWIAVHRDSKAFRSI